jgi:hypothetical protein
MQIRKLLRLNRHDSMIVLDLHVETGRRMKSALPRDNGLISRVTLVITTN